MKKRRKLIIALAYCNRYLFPCLALYLPMAFIPLHQDPFLFVLSMGIALLVFSAYELIGYLCRWTHIFCSLQNANRLTMTPEDVDWGWIKKSDAYGIPAVFGVIGMVIVIVSLAFLM